MHGGQLSAGVGAVIESAALAMAASRYLTSVAAKTGDAETFQRAARLAESARQHELAAWELAAREALARKDLEPDDGLDVDELFQRKPLPAAPEDTTRGH